MEISSWITQFFNIEKGGWVYILSNKTRTTLYTGVTSDLITRISRHRKHYYQNAFSARYRVYLLVYYEPFHSIIEAIAREKQIKVGSRKKKLELINKMNPFWKDLYQEVLSG